MERTPTSTRTDVWTANSDGRSATSSGAATSSSAKETSSLSKADTWYAILCANDDIDASIAQARSQGATAESLEQLRAQIQSRIEQLRSELRSVPGYERILLVLVLYLDERVMRRLPDSTRHLWRPMQVDWIGSTNGGTEFYRILDSLVQDESTSNLLLEVFYYCLNNGFVGVYVDNPDAIENYKQYLRTRVAPEHHESDGSDESRSDQSLPKQRQAAWYYLGTGVLIVLMAVVATALSNIV